jgi:hypothetical protein
MDSRITCCFYENLTFMLFTYCDALAKFYLPKPYTYMFYDNKTRRLQTYVLMSWIRIDFYGSRLRSWPFLCVTFHASLFVHALWVFTSKISQTSLGLHPKPKTSFCDHLLVHNSIWVWSKILDGDSNIPQDYGIYTYFSSHFPCHTWFSEENQMHLICAPGSSLYTYDRHHEWNINKHQ